MKVTVECASLFDGNEFFWISQVQDGFLLALVMALDFVMNLIIRKVSSLIPTLAPPLSEQTDCNHFTGNAWLWVCDHV